LHRCSAEIVIFIILGMQGFFGHSPQNDRAVVFNYKNGTSGRPSPTRCGLMWVSAHTKYNNDTKTGGCESPPINYQIVSPYFSCARPFVSISPPRTSAGRMVFVSSPSRKSKYFSLPFMYLTIRTSCLAR